METKCNKIFPEPVLIEIFSLPVLPCGERRLSSQRVCSGIYFHSLENISFCSLSRMRFCVVFKGQEVSLLNELPHQALRFLQPESLPCAHGSSVAPEKAIRPAEFASRAALGGETPYLLPTQLKAKRPQTVLRRCCEELAVIPSVVRQRILRRCVSYPGLACCAVCCSHSEGRRLWSCSNPSGIRPLGGSCAILVLLPHEGDPGNILKY